jgi:Abortive infection alpha
MNDDPFGGIPEKFAEEVAKLVPEIYEDAGRPALRKLGKTIGLLWDSCVYLRAAIYSAKTRARLLPRLQKYLCKIAAIENDNLCEVPAQIGVPVLERVSYVDDNDIADMFINLLTTASSQDTSNLAHPRFVSLIDNICPDEARMLAYLGSRERIDFVRIGEREEESRFSLGEPLIAPRPELNLKFPENMTLYMENLHSLGILGSSESFQNVDYLEDEEVLKTYREKIAFAHEVWMGHYSVTRFGKMFISACTVKLSSEEVGSTAAP